MDLARCCWSNVNGILQWISTHKSIKEHVSLLVYNTVFDYRHKVLAIFDVTQLISELFKPACSAISSLIKSQAAELLFSLRAGIRVFQNPARHNGTKRLYSIPADPSMPRAHTSELDRLRLCQRTASDLRGLSSPQPTIALHVNVFMYVVTVCRGAHVIACAKKCAYMFAWVLISDCMCCCTHISTILLIIVLVFSSAERLQAQFCLFPPSYSLLSILSAYTLYFSFHIFQNLSFHPASLCKIMEATIWAEALWLVHQGSRLGLGLIWHVFSDKSKSSLTFSQAHCKSRADHCMLTVTLTLHSNAFLLKLCSLCFMVRH